MSVTTQDLWKCIHGDEESPHTWTGAGVFWLLPVSLSCDGFVVFRLWRGGNKGSEKVESFNQRSRISHSYNSTWSQNWHNALSSHHWSFVACLGAYVVLRLIPWKKIWLSIMISMSSCICWLLYSDSYLGAYFEVFIVNNGFYWRVNACDGMKIWYEKYIFFIIYIIFTGERHCVGPMVAGLRACRHICWKTPSELVQYHQKTNNIVSRVLYNTAADGDRFFALNEIILYFWNIHW